MTGGIAFRSQLLTRDSSGTNERENRATAAVGTPEQLLIVICCAAALGIGLVALAGYAMGDRSIAAVFPGFKPVAAVSASCFILLGVAILWLARPTATSTTFASAIACVVAIAAAAELALTVANVSLQHQQHGGVLLHPYPTTAIFILCVSSALFCASRGLELLAHAVSSVVLLAATTIIFGYIFEIPTFADPGRRLVPVRGSIIAVLLLAAAVLVVRPRGWTAIVLSRTSTGVMLRLLLPTVFIIPVVGGLLPLLHGQSWYTPTVGLTFAAAVNLVFTAVLILGAGAVLYDREMRARQLEAEREAAAGYARTLIEASLDPLVTIGPDGKITDVNAATERVTGRSRSELVGTDFSEYFTEPAQARAGYLKVFEDGEVRDYELTVRHADGRTVDVLYNATVYRDRSGRIAGIFAAARDVTERKKAQQALARTVADLERSNKELEQFAYVASHDLQEPLRMVSSFTQLLAQRYGESLDANAHEFIGFAVDGANRMQRLITDLLKYSRVGTRGAAFEKTDSRAALGYAIENLASAIGETGALITSGELPAVMADEGQLVQLFQNLIGNAIKFRRKDERPRITISAARDGSMWRFEVEDNGIGIPPEFQPRLFVIFQRLHGRDEYPGTGIGLAICKRIVDRHGGRLWMQSEAGDGATFFFTLPAAD